MNKGISRALGMAAVLGIATAAQAGPDWVEGDHGDAGSLPKTSQPINMSNSPTGSITKVSGRISGTSGDTIGGDDFQDMYKFRILAPTTFCASTSSCTDKDTCGSAEFNTRLWLFNVSGTGITANDDAFIITVGTTGGSYLTGISCDGSGSMVLAPGDYLLAITPSFFFPQSTGGDIFCFGCENDGEPTCSLGSTEVSGPDGPGGGLPIEAWGNNFFDGLVGPPTPCSGCGDYVIAMCFGTVGIVTGGTVEASVDIKPGGCPNPFNRGSNGVLPVSLLGSATFDVQDVELSTVRISRVDGIGGSQPPHEVPPGPHSVYTDNGTPYTGVECGCHTLDGDGIVDLSMKFKSTEMVIALQLNSLPNGALVPLKITGELEDGTLFEAQDCIRLVPPGTPPGMMAVAAPSGAFIETSPPDLALDSGGFGNFQRTYPTTTVVTLAAPVMVPGKMFAGWKVDGNPQLVTNQQLTVTITSATHAYEAVYLTVPMAR